MMTKIQPYIPYIQPYIYTEYNGDVQEAVWNRVPDLSTYLLQSKTIIYKIRLFSFSPQMNLEEINP